MPFVVVYDSCVLYPAPLRDLLLSIAAAPGATIQARWTDKILDETFDNILKDRKDLDPKKLANTRADMIEAVPDCLVTGYEGLIAGLGLPDPDDRHVLAAAIRANAQAIITFNLKDFPEAALAEYHIEPKHPDDFLVETLDLAEGLVVQATAEILGRLKKPPKTIHQLLDTYREQRLVQFVARMRGLWPSPV
jgi:predicted nucleic acid-binding protein